MKKKVKGNDTRPRLVVFRSNKHIYVQAIDDNVSKTITSCSTTEKEIKSQLSSTATVEASLLVGQKIAERLKQKQITSAIFDRNGRVYHGRVKGIAEGARSGGLKI